MQYIDKKDTVNEDQVNKRNEISKQTFIKKKFHNLKTF